MANVHERRFELRGAPRSVRGFMPVAPDRIRVLPHVVFDTGIEHDGPIPVQTVPRGAHTEMRVVLPAMTRPGEYRGTLQIGDDRFAVLALVEASTHLTCIPPRIELVYGANRRLRETLTLVNDGNVPAEIAKHYGFGLFESSGLDRAIRNAFEARDVADRSIVEAFSNAAADEYGGLVAASVAEGAGPLEPGAMRSIALSFRLTEKARRGASYFGYLSIENLAIPVLVRNADHAAKEAAS